MAAFVKDRTGSTVTVNETSLETENPSEKDAVTVTVTVYCEVELTEGAE